MSIYVPTQGNYSNLVVGNTSVAGSASHTISITGAGSSYTSGQVLTVSNGTGTTAINPTWATNVARTTAKGQMHLEGADADLIINGVSLKDLLNGITDRLSILQPKPEMLEKYDNLRQAYEHYKTLEALLYDESQDTKK